MRALEDASISKNWESFLRYLDRRLVGLQTGVPELDQYLLGLGGLVICQGDTGSCKSTFALQVAHYHAAKGLPVLLLDKENGEGRVRSRLTCQANDVSETTILAADLELRRKLVNPVTRLPFYIFTEQVRDQTVVAERVGELVASGKGKSAILVVDSLQALTPVDSDQRVNLEKWLYFFDALKVEYNGRLTILVTSETKRAGYGVDEGVGRGKGSNSIEFKAETLLDMREEPETGLVLLQVAKHRDGVKGGRFRLQKQLEDPKNPRSFVFKLRSAEGPLEI